MLFSAHVNALDRETALDVGVAATKLANESPRAPLTCEVISGATSSRRVTLRLGIPVEIGSDPACALVVDDPRVSRKHASIVRNGDGVRLIDTGSKNGTFVGATRVTDVLLGVGSSFRIGNSTLRLSTERLVVLPPSTRTRFGRLIGTSAAIRELFALLELAAASNSTVLIQGESGTGKELAARELHDHSSRAGGPFVVVDCASIPTGLAESALFGHTKGAFTGAVGQRDGAFVKADGGTLFLDEIGELPLDLQPRLLRALESRTVQAVGSDDTRAVDVRVVAATHRDLNQWVRDGRFRFDLYYRLAVVQVLMPALRERPEDTRALVEAFCEERGLAADWQAENAAPLLRYDWPGNVRELRNVLERAWVFAGSRPQPFASLSFQIGEPSRPPVAGDVDTALTYKDAKEKFLAHFDAVYLTRLFEECAGNISEAARRADLTRRHMRELLRRCGLVDG